MRDEIWQGSGLVLGLFSFRILSMPDPPTGVYHEPTMSDTNGKNGDQYDELLANAERVLTDRFGTAVRLGEVQQISEPRRRNLLLRCRVLDGPLAAPMSVILKRARQRGYDPDDLKSRPAVGLFRDWAGLEFLNSLGDERLASPQFYGGDREAGFFLMEDFGGSQDLDHVLTCGSAEQARHALLLLAEALGRIHALTAGRSDQYQQIRDALGPGDQMHRERLAKHARDYAPYLAERCRDLGVDVASGFFEDVETVAVAMAEPGDFLTYTHADACPDNSVLVGDRICLIDYEFGSFRHALLDGVYGWIRFPTCWCVRDIPDSVVAEMETAYRQQLAHGCPAAMDDVRYFRAVADACSYWILENLAQLLPRSLQYEEPKGTSTNRQRLLMRLAAFQQVALRAGHLEGLRETLASLLAELRRRWRDNMPQYDAFNVLNDFTQENAGDIVTAVRDGQVDQVNCLLEKSCVLVHAKDVDEDQTPLLFLAIENQHAELVQLLLENGADPHVTTRSGWTALGRACSQATPTIVDLLLDHGADLNERDAWGTLPLYGAMDSQAMLRHLLQRGATADVKMAIDMDRLDIAEHMLKQDPAQASIRFGTGLTLLHDSARVGDARVNAIDLLVRYGAGVNATTNWEATPLHLAVFHGNAQAAKFLIDHGASLEVRDDYGLTPLQLAEAKNHTACTELLRSRQDAANQPPEWSTVGFHTTVVGITFDQPKPAGEERGGTQAEQVATIDEFYSSLGRSRIGKPHPMDEFATNLPFEEHLGD